MAKPTKAEIERQVYICRRNAHEWRDVMGNIDGEAEQWEEQAQFLARLLPTSTRRKDG